MSLISYSQNREDILLHRALADVESGFYVDVGAHDPDSMSVTKLFYDLGWHGINIEPVQFWYEKLTAARTRDLNLRLAAGSKSESADFFEVVDTGLSTLDRNQAEIHKKSGFQIKEISTEIERLDTLLTRYAVEEIHFLKIDVEGAEYDALLGLDLNKWRPWIIVVEATLPLSTELASHSWERLIVEKSYDFVYFDGLNNYYLANEKSHLQKLLSVQPNVFDDYATATEIEAKRSEAQLEIALEKIRSAEILQDSLLVDNDRLNLSVASGRVEIERLTTELRAALSRGGETNRELQEQIEAIYRSTSWRISKPIRCVRLFARNLLLRHPALQKSWLSIRPLIVRLRNLLVR